MIENFVNSLIRIYLDYEVKKSDKKSKKDKKKYFA